MSAESSAPPAVGSAEEYNNFLANYFRERAIRLPSAAAPFGSALQHHVPPHAVPGSTSTNINATIPNAPQPQHPPPMPYLDPGASFAYSAEARSICSSAPSSGRATSIPPVELDTDGVLPCDLWGFRNCEIRFHMHQRELWVNHICNHMHILPLKTTCWFCDRKFEARSTDHEHRRDAFRRRLMCIADHIRDDPDVDVENLAQAIRPDFFLLDHLVDTRVVNREVAEQARGLTELPIRPKGYVFHPVSQPGTYNGGAERMTTQRAGGHRRRDTQYHR